MVLNHLAAILFFSGPLFWAGLAMAAVPADIARLLPLRHAGLPRALRWIGLALLLAAIAI